jgi:hypothetical protein
MPNEGQINFYRKDDLPDLYLRFRKERKAILITNNKSSR